MLTSDTEARTAVPPKRIVHISSVHQALDNRILFKECTSLAQAGYDVHLVARTDTAKIVNGVTIHPVSAPTSRFQRFWVTQVECFKQSLKLKADLYHFHDPELIPAALLLRLARRKPVIFDMHENLPKAIVSKPWIPKALRPMVVSAVRFIERLTLNRFSVIYAEDSYKTDYGFVKHSTIVHNFPRVSELITINEEKNKRFSLAYLGTISEARGFSLMLRTVKQLDDAGFAIELHIIGQMNDKMTGQIQDLASALKSSAIIPYGFQRADAAYRIVSKCHVGLAVLKPIPNYLESYPTKIFEYMALGLPVITSNFPLYQTVITDDSLGYLVDPESNELFAALSKLYATLGESPKANAASREVVARKYSWEKESKDFLAWVSGILAQA